MTTNSAIDAEREAWSRLVDSNVRSGIIACIWCMKAQVVKITAMAFHQWKAYKIFDIRIKTLHGEKGAYDSSNSNATEQAAAAAAQYFRHLMSQIPPASDLTKNKITGRTYTSSTTHSNCSCFR